MNRYRLLLIDDEENTLFVLRSILEDDYDVVTANCGEVGLECFAEQHFDMVISDQRMPGLTGIATLERIAAMSEDCIRIILTAYADFDAVADAMNGGTVYRFVLKPWNPEEMIVTIRQALEHLTSKRQERELIRRLEESNHELRTTTEELRRTDAALVRSEKLAAVGKLAGSMIHEIQNYLLIGTAIPPLQRRYSGDEELQLFLRAVGAMEDAVTGMLEGYRYYLHGDELPFRWEDADLAEIAARTVEVCRLSGFSAERNILFEGGGPVPLRTDVNKVRQVLLNLVKNACQATVPGGHITVSYRVHEAGVTLRVEDDGSGISPADQERLFDAFFSTRGDAGLGLGLHICKSFVEGLGGTINVRSTPGVGTLFLVHLPCA